MIERIAYLLLGIAFLAWLGAMIVGFIQALPYGIFGLFAIVGIGLLFGKVFQERLANKEDDHYSKNVNL